MQTNNLWSVDNCGTVHSFDIKTKQWFQLSYQRIEFKRLSSSPQSIWAIGGDHQIYLYLPITDIPIRVCGLTYENHRWNPLTQFSSALLPTDRPLFSCADGTLALPKEDFALPSKCWQWESDWYIDNNIEGEPLGPEGWTYAIDFPMKFSSERRWNSLVRRRRWLRYRRYVCVNEWALLESLHGDFVTEPFIDIATGAYDMPGANKDTLGVWAVTVIGRVMFRTGVDKYSPEGVAWIGVPVPNGWEVNQIACGPTGLVWAVAWDGSALVRTGINRDNIYGNSWVRVEAPNDSKLMQVSVGVDVVWAVTRDSKVWFRKGIRGLNSGHNDSCAQGSGWVEMIQEMSLLSVTSNDQVWALGVDRKSIYFRSGITYGELTGKSWKLMSRQPINVSNLKTNNRCVEQQMDSISISSQDSCFTDSVTLAWIWISASSCVLNTDSFLHLSSSSHDSQSSPNQSFGTGIDCLTMASDDYEWKTTILKQLSQRFNTEMKDFLPTYQRAVESGTWIKSGTCFVGKCDNKTCMSWWPGLIELERQGVESTTESGTLTISYSQKSPQNNSKAKLNKNVLNLAEIGCAFVDSTETGMYSTNNCLVVITNNFVVKLKFGAEPELDDWLASINQVCGDLHGINGSTAISGALLYCLTNRGDLYVGHKLSCDNIFCYLLCGGHFKSFTQCLGVLWAISYDNVLWVHNGTGSGGGVYKGITGVNSNCNPMSDIMTFYCYENQRWNPLMGFAPKGETNTSLFTDLYYRCSLSGLPTDRSMWSDRSGKHELTKDGIKLPSKSWQWISDWNVDYSAPDGVDSEGWQYAIDFPFDYHSERKFTDYVRRRRWSRRCKLSTTGPFADLSSIAIISASINCLKCETKNAKEDSVFNAWAVSSEGEAMCRLGVSRMCRRGLSWKHIPCDQPLIDVSVGGREDSGVKVWAIARDGSAFLRHGITSTCPSGTLWFHIESPRPQCPLKQISVGKSSVWAIDVKKRLWFREEIVSTFPEGTHWKKVEERVKQMSVNNCDELWAILTTQDNDSFVDTIAKRVGITCDDSIGTQWQMFGKHLNCMQTIGCTNRDIESNE